MGRRSAALRRPLFQENQGTRPETGIVKGGPDRIFFAERTQSTLSELQTALETLLGLPHALRKRLRQRATMGLQHAAFGDQSGHEPRGCDIESVVGNRRAVGNGPHGLDRRGTGRVDAASKLSPSA